MNFLINDCSLHGQFHDQSAFVDAIDRIMAIRKIVHAHKLELYCHRGISQAKALSNQSVLEAISKMSHDQRQVLFPWLHKHGPFWDVDKHDSDEYFEYNGDIVTDTAVGEAAYRCAHGAEHHLVSLNPSKWVDAPVADVRWHKSDSHIEKIKVCNHWSKNTVKTVLKTARPEITSWPQLCAESVHRFTNIIFSEKCFAYLYEHPFSKSVATQISKRLEILNQYQGNLMADGAHTSVSRRIHQEYFASGRNWFSDSSPTEKKQLKKKLTFPHPDPNRPGETLCCTWHGKVKSGTNPIRIHFSWPDKPLYVVYVGPKLTKT